MSSQVHRPSRRWGQRVAGAALAGLLGIGLLSACGGGGDDAGSSDSAALPAGTEVAQPGAPGKAYDGDKAGTDTQPRTIAGQKLVRRANLNLKVDSLTPASQRIRSIATQQNGVVVTEELYSGERGRDTSGTITISVPAASLDATIALIEKVGDVQFRNTSSEDVTATYVDTDARVKSMTASVQRIRDLLGKATTVTDLVALENELSQRQAELDGLTAQLTTLKDQVSMSPITISLSTDDFEAVTAPGFWSGLKSGWAAFLSSVSVLVTVLGAVLPFAVALGLISAPVIWWLRRRRAARPAYTAPLVATGPMPPPSAG